MNTQQVTIKSKEMNGLAFFDNKDGAKVIQKLIASETSVAEMRQSVAGMCFWNLIAHGNNELVNKLYRELAKNDATAPIADAMRTKYAVTLIDRFGRGGLTDAKTERLYNSKGEKIASKWIERPAAFIRFRNEIGEEKLPGFEIVATRKKDGTLPDGMTQETVDNIRKAKKEIGERGVECLMVPWKTADQERADAAFDANAVIKAYKKLMIRHAKNAYVNGITANELSQIGHIVGVTGDDLVEVQNAIVATKGDADTKAVWNTVETASELLKTIEHDPNEGKEEIPNLPNASEEQAATLN